MTRPTAFIGATIFDGNHRHQGRALLVDGGRVAGLLLPGDLPAGTDIVTLDGGLLAAGFVDLQVNGGGGVMLNDGPSAEAMVTIARAHRRFGTTGLLPTLITDTPAATAAAIEAAAEAVSRDEGILGLHLEGPHLAPARKGAHVAALMHPMSEADADALVAARERIGCLKVTVAVEQVPPAIIRRLVDGGVLVSLGHSDASYEAARRAIDAGARLVTHLFNAMSPLTHRAPGLVGAALDAGEVWCGLIADGHHVHPAALALALRAKRGPGRLFLVTDAMSTVGADGDRFVLNGRVALRSGGRLTLEDGTLAGADIDMARSVAFAARHLDVSADEALRMASLWPATAAGLDGRVGRLAPGLAADLVWLAEDLGLRAVYRGGRRA